jgi:hypothetical protein
VRFFVPLQIAFDIKPQAVGIGPELGGGSNKKALHDS